MCLQTLANTSEEPTRSGANIMRAGPCGADVRGQLLGGVLHTRPAARATPSP